MSFPVTVNIIGKSVRLFSFPGAPETRIRTMVNKLVNEELVIQKRMFERTTATWRHQPQFIIDRASSTGDDVIGSVWTDDEIYFWLDRGTSVRYATMSPEFKPKTKPGRLRSDVGAFPDPLFVNRDVPRPGIEARRFSDKIYDSRRNIYANKARTLSRKIFTGSW